jgi:hypothetical protein
LELVPLKAPPCTKLPRRRFCDIAIVSLALSATRTAVQSQKHLPYGILCELCRTTVGRAHFGRVRPTLFDTATVGILLPILGIWTKKRLAMAGCRTRMQISQQHNFGHHALESATSPPSEFAAKS